jgi:hypothetical protein
MKLLLILASTFIIIISKLSGAFAAPPAPVPQTGQTACYNTSGTVISCAGTGQDGESKTGVAWPNPRFTDNANGTVTDNLTGLIWLKNANCFGTKIWNDALAAANSLATGSCGLTDGSKASDWHLPTIRELRGLVYVSRSYPALTSGHPFTAVQAHDYWSSSTGANDTDGAWTVDMGSGFVDGYGKGSGYYVWPVRSGQ